jgi:hypothetical protein
LLAASASTAKRHAGATAAAVKGRAARVDREEMAAFVHLYGTWHGVVITVVGALLYAGVQIARDRRKL